MKSKTAVQEALRGRTTGTLPFVPLISRFAFALEQQPVGEVFSDPGLLSRCLLNAQRLFGYDAIVNVFDTTMEAEACEASLGREFDDGARGRGGRLPGHTMQRIEPSQVIRHGRIAVIMEATERLQQTVGSEVAVIGMVSGPLTLASHLWGNDFRSELENASEGLSPEADEAVDVARRVAVSLCKRYGEMGITAVLVAEDLLDVVHPDKDELIRDTFESIWRVTKFYCLGSVLLPKAMSNRGESFASTIGADAIIVPLNESGYLPNRLTDISNVSVGAGLPETTFSDCSGSIDALAKVLTKASDNVSFVSTATEIPANCSPSRMQQIATIVRATAGREE